jgi:hypothetical protein
MDNINLTLDPKRFPQLTMRYTEDRLRDQLVSMCQAQDLEITEKNLYSMAAILESDLQHMFA